MRIPVWAERAIVAGAGSHDGRVPAGSDLQVVVRNQPWTGLYRLVLLGTLALRVSERPYDSPVRAVGKRRMECTSRTGSSWRRSLRAACEGSRSAAGPDWVFASALLSADTLPLAIC